ncbi:MAG TPA: DNA-binding response regulator [Eoetvoesiella sp.]
MSTCRIRSSSAHVLLIDDNSHQIRLLVEALRASNIRVSMAFNGAQGYDRAMATLPDLILLDVRTPRMDGFTLCRWLKANPATTHIPVIFLSSSSDISDRLIGLRDGGVDYILKPFVPEEVVARVQVHLRLAGRSTVDSHEEPVGAMTDTEQVLVRAAQRQLQACLLETPDASDLARQLGVNKRKLSRAFRKNLGMTIFEYWRHERMHLAERLLRQTSLSIAAIATELGFSSAANFSTAFRAYAGVSPTVFRRSGRS